MTCRCLRRDRIFGAERDGASPVSTRNKGGLGDLSSSLLIILTAEIMRIETA